MRLTSTSFADGSAIPGECAFCIPDPVRHTRLGGNRSPQLAWTDLPVGTRSLALICHDPDVPSRGDDVNKEGRSVSASLPRVEFIHWVLIDLPPEPAAIAEGEFCSEITPHGKPGPAAARGARQGINDFSQWFGNDAAMGGDYYGYDGPCPPWNDELLHHYVFTLYALDVAELAIEGRFTANEVRAMIKRHVLDQACITGLYSLNPTVSP